MKKIFYGVMLLVMLVSLASCVPPPPGPGPAGMVWVPGHYGPYGWWHPGHYRPAW